jgi:hypothetical protein
VLRDYEKYPRSIDASCRRACSSARPERGRCCRTTLRVCIGWFCRNVNRVERVEESQHALAATRRSEPQRREVRRDATAALAGEHGGTLVHYRTSITPAFWIPSGGRPPLDAAHPGRMRPATCS